MPLTKSEAHKLVRRRHPEWVEHWPSWCRLYDSLEGGDRYRYADYATPPDRDGVRGPAMLAAMFRSWDRQTGEVRTFDWDSIVSRNLIPHRSEMSEDGYATYALRLARTPPPTEFARTIETHLAKVFAQEVDRKGPAEVEAWWEDVDGRGTPIRRFVEEMVGPLLLALGQIDVVVDHPPRPADVPADQILSRADASALGLDMAVPNVILPENVLWWRTDNRGRYTELLTLERDADPEPDARPGLWYRHWTAAGTDVYTEDGVFVPEKSSTYAYGMIPVVRLFDRRKPRCSNVGKSRYEGIAALQRAAYNAESERSLADVIHSHPTLMLPLDATGDGQTIQVGPTGVIPMVPLTDATGSTTGYQGAEYLEPPTGAQAALREHIQDYRDSIDRDGSLAKPAGLSGGTTTAQSGISKIMDGVDGNAILARVAEVLEVAEVQVAKLALTVLSDGRADPTTAGIEVEYPKQFGLYTVDDVVAVLDALQAAATRAGALPTTEAELLKRLVLTGLPGIEESVADDIAAEIESFAEEAARSAQLYGQQAMELMQSGPAPGQPDDPGRADQGGVGVRPQSGREAARLPGP